MKLLKFSSKIQRARRVVQRSPIAQWKATESALWAAYQANPGPDAINALVVHYEDWIRGAALKFWSRVRDTGIALDDLVQEAMIAAVDCIRRFEPARGLKFFTFAAPRIRGAMLDWLRHEDHVPRLDRQQGIKGKLMLRLDTMAFDGETEGRGVSYANMREMEPPSPYDEDWWRYALRGLKQDRRLILIGYYRQGMTMKAIGEGLGMSESRVSQLHSMTIHELKAKGTRLKEQLAAA